MVSFSFAVQAALKMDGPAVEWAGVRYCRELTSQRVVRNGLPQRNASHWDEGAMCEVLVNGQFGYAATADLTESGLQQAFKRAVATTAAASRRCSMPSTSTASDAETR